ncbi:MAG TPA: polysaccharide biosynthesis/export family protein [Vicinamibacteria bacterium]|nr:polysaccharide biosynthesis/export family protein [Vicinamibacteria bacterium]
MRRLLGLALAVVCTWAVFADDYEIGAGDVLQVTVLGQSEMTGNFTVDTEGLLTFPVLGKVKASQMSTRELERKLTTLLADGYIRRPQVTVTVHEYRSQKVFVTGEVQRPGPYALKADRSLLALLGEIGPLTPNAGHEVVVMRPPPGAAGPVLPLPPASAGGEISGSPDTPPAAGSALEVPGADVFHISLQELQSGNPERNILLQAGDTVYVPRAAQVYITGSVVHPGPYRFQEGTTLLQALTVAGGVTERGSAKRVKVIRTVGGKKQEVKLQLSDLVQPEDTIVVPERFF